MKSIRASIVGASGYTGAELLRLLDGHPQVTVTGVYGKSHAGKDINEVLPGIDARALGISTVQALDFDTLAKDSDVVFCALPHGASQQTVQELRKRSLCVFDLSADFRLQDVATYERWYGTHTAPKLLDEAVYGLVEVHREKIRTADLIAVPGCYTTTSILTLAPLLKAGLIQSEGHYHRCQKWSYRGRT